MGWGRTLLLGDIGNRLDIEDTERDIEAIKRRLDRKGNVDREQDLALSELAREHEELKLYLSSLLRLLVSKNVLTQEELTTFVERIDSSVTG